MLASAFSTSYSRPAGVENAVPLTRYRLENKARLPTLARSLLDQVLSRVVGVGEHGASQHPHAHPE